MKLPFTKVKALESQIEEFLNIIIQGALAMEQALLCYIECDHKSFAERIEDVSDMEKKADQIRKQSETMLYTHSLIPESRGDVLGLLENMDSLIDSAKAVLMKFEVEKPNIEPEFHAVFRKLMKATADSVDNVVGAARAYFRDVKVVRDYINKVHFYETEADKFALDLKRQIYESQFGLSRKIHLRYFVDQIENISDIAENVAERLSIAAIKRSL